MHLPATLSRVLFALLCLITLHTGAQAGSACIEKLPTPESVRNALDLALSARNALDESGAQVALIARVGQDLSKYHLRFSHIGIVWRDHPEGRWLLVHELNECGTARSALFNEGLGNFFLDNMHAYETQIVIPGDALQQRIVQLLRGSTARSLHEPQYNMLAFPYSTKYQNSNQWTLEMLAAANASGVQINNREQAQAWLKLAGYQPTTLEIPTFTRLGGRIFRANIAFDDHPFERRMAGHIDTVTVESVVNFIETRDPQAREINLALK